MSQTGTSFLHSSMSRTVQIFSVIAVLSDPVERVRNLRRLLERDILGRHDSARAVFGILQQLVYVGAHLRVCFGQNTLDHIRRHLLQHIRHIIGVNICQHLLQLVIGKALDQLLLAVLLHFNERVRRIILAQKPEGDQPLLVCKLVKNLRNIDRIDTV